MNSLAPVIAFFVAVTSTLTFADEARHSSFAKENLVAWCIVPFDAKQRGPAERAEMVRRLGLRRIAYDWRQEHVPQFEEEILQYEKHGIEFFAFWNWHDSMEPLIRRHGIRPQIWKTNPSPKRGTQQEKVKAAADALQPLVAKTKELGLKLGLYNHGGWGGEPQNLVAVCEFLRATNDAQHVGIIYNFHHGHERIADFDKSLALMQPYLLCINLNGMLAAEAVEQSASNKILTIGSGDYERQMIESVRRSDYSGPIGILDHRKELDAEESLRLNLMGLKRILATTSSAKADSSTR